MKFADPQLITGPVDVTLPPGFTGNVEQLRDDLAAMGFDVRSVERAAPRPAEGEPRVTFTSGPGGAIAETMRAMDDFHVYAAARPGKEAESRAARRRFDRVALGGCPCGEVTGEALCPWCDNETLPEGMREAGARLSRAGRARQAERDVRDALAKMMADLRPRPKAEPFGATRSPNRHERRRARSRRWRG